MRSTVAISRSTSCTWLSSRFNTSWFTDTEHHDTVAFTSMLTSSGRSEEHTSELQSLMRISYAVFCLKLKNYPQNHIHQPHTTKHKTKIQTHTNVNYTIQHRTTQQH